MDVSLVMFKSDGTRRDFPLTKPRVVVGRKPKCDLRIPLSSVSRQHCEITIDDQRVSIRDLGSSNGTYHNNVRVQEAVLSAGDEIVVGPVVFTLQINGKPGQIKPVRTIVGSDGTGDASGVTTAPESPAKAAAAKAPAAKPPAQDIPEDPDDFDLDLSELDLGDDSSTVDINIEIEDPIAALDQMAEVENGAPSKGKAKEDDSSDDSDLQYLLDDEDDKIQP